MCESYMMWKKILCTLLLLVAEYHFYSITEFEGMVVVVVLVVVAAAEIKDTPTMMECF